MDSSGNPDFITSHYFLLAGSLFKDWLCHIFNKIVELKTTPASFKVGTIISIYEGKIKDLLSTIYNYRHTTLKSAIAE